MSKILAEITFSHTEQEPRLLAESREGGEARILVAYPDQWFGYALTLQQTIGLRDFLNRHIDSLALGSIGASTERSSDDPTQLPAEHVITPCEHKPFYVSGWEAATTLSAYADVDVGRVCLYVATAAEIEPLMANSRLPRQAIRVFSPYHMAPPRCNVVALLKPGSMDQSEGDPVEVVISRLRHDPAARIFVVNH